MLRISEAAARIGIAPSTLRAFADRGLIRFTEMPNGERRFEESAVEAFREEGGNPPQPRAADTSAQPPAPRPRRPAWTEVPPWERPALAAEAEVRIEKAKRDISRLAADDAARAEQAQRDRIAAMTAEAEQERQRIEAQQKERAAQLTESMKPLKEAINSFVARREEQANADAERVAKDVRAAAKRLDAMPEDRELESMERAYQQRRDLLDLATLARRFRR